MSPYEDGTLDYQNEPCHANACAIQDCLKAKGYNESKCTHFIDQLYACCASFYDAQRQKGVHDGDLKKTVSCPFPQLLDLKISQRLEDGGVDAQLLDVMKEKRRK